MKRGNIAKPAKGKVPVVVTRVMNDMCECCRINGNYSKGDLLYIDTDFLTEAKVYTVQVSHEFFKKIMRTQYVPFRFETKLSKQWDHAAVEKYDYLQLCVTKTKELAYISYEHIQKIRRTVTIETGPGKSITNYELLHQFTCTGHWKVNTREILRVSQ